MKKPQVDNKNIIEERVLGRFPNESLGKGSKNKNIRRANRYLAYQEKRLSKLIAQGHYDFATVL